LGDYTFTNESFQISLALEDCTSKAAGPVLASFLRDSPRNVLDFKFPITRLHVHYSAFGHFFAKFSGLTWFIGPMLRVSRPLCLFGFRGIELVWSRKEDRYCQSLKTLASGPIAPPVSHAGPGSIALDRCLCAEYVGDLFSPNSGLFISALPSKMNTTFGL
jgi:hypothetical protein